MSLHATGLGYQVADTWLVRDVDVDVSPGQMLAILGPNGAGKSTLFKMLCGEWPASEGDVQLLGKSYSKWSAQELALHRAVLPQHSSLTFPFTVEEVVLLGRAPHKTGIKRDLEIVAELIELCDLQRLKTRLYPWLSGGEKQRVQLARVLAQIWPSQQQDTKQGHDKLLFLDEPTSALDIAHQHIMLKLAKDLTSRGYSVIIILHDLNLAAAYADKILMMQEGKRVGFGSVEDVFQQELIQRVFDVPVEIVQHPERGTPWVIW
ncbi:MAG: heme ABC transporter ATP-binding protein [Pseudomonadales bacterium]|nr:heme ABC transporter ATP-binding protein [Pseudomonadales bacterium]